MYDATVWTVGIWSGYDQFGCSGYVVFKDVPHIASQRLWGAFTSFATAKAKAIALAKAHQAYAVYTRENGKSGMLADFRKDD